MEDILSRIDLLHNLFLGCLFATIVLFLVSIFFFIKLGIGKYIVQKEHKKQVNKRMNGVFNAQKIEPTDKIEMDLRNAENETATQILRAETQFYVKREVLLIHTNEIIE